MQYTSVILYIYGVYYEQWMYNIIILFEIHFYSTYANRFWGQNTCAQKYVV